MKIRLEHQNLGAVLMQVAEHPKFTAINALKKKGDPVNNGFLVNDDVALFCKYATEPNGAGEYVFTFTEEHRENISHAVRQKHNVFLALVCVEDAEICCLTEEQFNELIGYRKASAKVDEDQYQILVTAKKNASLRA